MSKIWRSGRFQSGRTRLDVGNITESLQNMWEEQRLKILPAVILVCLIVGAIIGIVNTGASDYEDRVHSTELNAALQETHRHPSTPVPENVRTIWYTAEFDALQVSGASEMMKTSLGRPCRKLTAEEIAHKSLASNTALTDLTAVAHILCHQAILESINYPKDPIIVTPNMLHVSSLASAVEMKPNIILHNDSPRLLSNDKNVALENLCMIAVINYPRADADHQKEHYHFDYENRLDIGERLPFGKFLHHSRNVIYKDKTLSTFEEDYMMWDRDPKKGECAILLNPELRHQKPMLRSGYDFYVPVVDNVVFSDTLPHTTSVHYVSWKGEERSFTFDTERMSLMEEHVAHVTNFLHGDVVLQTQK